MIYQENSNNIFLKEYYNNIISEENDNDNNCNSFFIDNSFCQWNNNDNKCECNYQKDDLRYSFNSPNSCCDRFCLSLPKDDCIKTTKYLEGKYYCNTGNECKEYKGIILNSKISANNCGNDPLNNQLILPYLTKEECEKSVDVCDKYNILNRPTGMNEAECIKDVNCGFCKNNTGGGKCISGTPEGPNDLQKYYYCVPGSTNEIFSYKYGDHMEFLLQK